MLLSSSPLAWCCLIRRALRGSVPQSRYHPFNTNFNLCSLLVLGTSTSTLWGRRSLWSFRLVSTVILGGQAGPNKSFKPTPHRGVNSVLYATLHAVATPPRGGLTPALGGRKAFGGFAFQHVDFTGFGWRCSSVCFTRRCFFGQVRRTRSNLSRVTLAGFGNGDWRAQLSRN